MRNLFKLDVLKVMGITALAAVIGFSLAGCDTAGDDTSGSSGAVTFVIKSEADVDAAKAKIAENGDGTETKYKAYTLDIQADVVVTEEIKFWAFKIIEFPVQYITITVIGNKRLTQSSNNACLFSIRYNQKLIIDSAELTLEGSEDHARSIVDIGVDSTLELKNGALISNGCDGVEVSYGGTFIMSGGSITGYISGTGDGVYIDGGLFTMSGGTISDNGSRGVYSGVVSEELVFTMTDGTIKDNRYGGVSIHGIFTMTGGTISGNRKLEYSGMGGGVYVGGTFTMENGTITDNESSKGGGVYVDGTFTMSNGTISENKSHEGGGVYVGGTFTMEDGIISDNEVTANVSGAYGYGGGIYVDDGSFTIEGGAISGNKVTATSGAYAFGGGVYLDGGSFTMEGGTISGNKLIADGNSRGGGVWFRSTFTKTGGFIYGNDESTNESLRNTFSGVAGPDNNGAAVFFSPEYYHNDTLDDTPAGNLSSEDTDGWTRRW